MPRRVFYFVSCLTLAVLFIFYLASENLSLEKFKPWFMEKEKPEEELTETSRTRTATSTVVTTSIPTTFTYVTSTTKQTTTKKTMHTKMPTLSVLSSRPENYNLNLTFCSIKVKNALMCPKLYTELGGRCFYSKSNVTCTDVRTKAFHDLRKAQLAITRLLGSFDLVAKKHNISYWLTSGTLLGAVRHKGFIPWDADADIELTLDEYEKFYRVASRDLPATIFFQNSESDLKLRPVDPEDYKLLRYKDIGLYRRTWNPRLRDIKSCYKYCIQYGCSWHDGLMVDLFVVDSVPKATFPLKEAFFEGLRFPIQNNWREILTDKYGKDFMDIPKNKAQTDWPDPLHSCEEIKRGKNN